MMLRAGSLFGAKKFAGTKAHSLCNDCVTSGTTDARQLSRKKRHATFVYERKLLFGAKSMHTYTYTHKHTHDNLTLRKRCSPGATVT